MYYQQLEESSRAARLTQSSLRFSRGDSLQAACWCPSCEYKTQKKWGNNFNSQLSIIIPLYVMSFSIRLRFKLIRKLQTAASTHPALYREVEQAYDCWTRYIY
jgi:hypothetical protein